MAAAASDPLPQPAPLQQQHRVAVFGEAAPLAAHNRVDDQHFVQPLNQLMQQQAQLPQNNAMLGVNVQQQQVRNSFLLPGSEIFRLIAPDIRQPVFKRSNSLFFEAWRILIHFGIFSKNFKYNFAEKNLELQYP